jgi:hypothetical protein
LINASALQRDLYIAPSDEIGEGKSYNYNNATGYYPKMAYLNRQLASKNADFSEASLALDKETANYTVNKAAYDNANEELVNNIEKFYRVAGFGYNDLLTPSELFE